VRPLGPGREVAPGVRVLGHLFRSRLLDVYDAFSEPRACRVVVKTVRPDHLGDRRTRARLLREGRLLRRLAHPHLVRAYDVRDGARPVVVLETLGGETLERRAARRLGAGDLAHLGTHLASALAYLHGEGVLHLDLKPTNVIADGGLAKVIDLSLAHAPGRVAAGRGTWCYMAPEQARGGEVGPAADVWGLGIVLLEAALGDNPFAEFDVEHPQLGRRAPRLATRRRRMPAALAGLVDSCLEPDAADRPTVGEALHGLRALT
jgi:eukaryotic-like serine/threonine-protein kinase